MRSKNICKFIPSKSAVALEVYNFVCETDRETMISEQELLYNRAVLVSSGEGTLSFGTQSVSVSKGALVFGFEGESFCADGCDGFQYIYISFAGERADELFRRFGINPKTRTVEGFEGLVPLWQESLARASEENVDLAAESMLLYALSRLRAELAEKNGIINKVVNAIEDGFNERELSIGGIAEELGYNVKYVSHVFKEKMGVSFSEYLRRVRLKYAVSLFDHGIDSVKNVALLSGFQDPLYFSTVFKKEIGISPKEYICKAVSRHS